MRQPVSDSQWSVNIGCEPRPICLRLLNSTMWGARAAFVTMAFLPHAELHAIMTGPIPRQAPGMSGIGGKINGFEKAAEYVDRGCGSILNGDTGVTTPVLAFAPGTPITVTVSSLALSRSPSGLVCALPFIPLCIVRCHSGT